MEKKRIKNIYSGEPDFDKAYLMSYIKFGENEKKRVNLYVSKNLYSLIVNTADVLKITNSSLILFLLFNAYDYIYELKIKKEYATIQEKLHLVKYIRAEKKRRAIERKNRKERNKEEIEHFKLEKEYDGEIECENIVTFYLTESAFRKFENLGYGLGLTPRQLNYLYIAMLYKNKEFMEKILEIFKKNQKIFQANQKEQKGEWVTQYIGNELEKYGMNYLPFSRFSSAYVWYQIFYN